MTKEEKLNELGYRYDEHFDFYVKDTHIESKQVFGAYKILRTISLNGKYSNFWVKPLCTPSLINMDTINEFYNVLRNEYYDTKKEFESLKGLEPSPKERLDDFVYEIINCEDDDVLIEELASYKRLLKDLEELERRRNKDVCGNGEIKFQLLKKGASTQ